ncbi:MAG: methyltransferase domain-containing protein [Treponema sp.]|nr:methyltransferase domain-containing protein [Treponema sp.]
MKQIPDFSSYYAKEYENFLYGKGFIPYCMKKTHILLERQFSEKDHFERVLEVGSGMAFHLKHVRHKFTHYELTDSNEDVIEKLASMEFPPNISIKRIDAGSLPYPDNSFDRLIANHALEHISYPHTALSEWSRVVKKNGIISIGLPCDPGFAWRFGRKVSSRKKAQAGGLKEYDLFMALEHVNSIYNLHALLQYFFEKKNEYFWPFPFKSLDFNLFYVAHITNDKA